MSRRGNAVYGTVIGVVIAAALLGGLTLIIRKPPKVDVDAVATAVKELTVPEGGQTPSSSAGTAASVAASTTADRNVFHNSRYGVELSYPSGLDISALQNPDPITEFRIVISDKKTGAKGQFDVACQDASRLAAGMKDEFKKAEDSPWQFTTSNLVGKFDTGIAPFFVYHSDCVECSGKSEAEIKSISDHLIGAACVVGKNEKGEDTARCMQLDADAALKDQFVSEILPSLRLDQQFKNTPTCIGVGEK